MKRPGWADGRDLIVRVTAPAIALWAVILAML